MHRFRITTIAFLLLAIATAGALSCRRSPQQNYASLIESGNRYLAQKDYVRATIQFRNAAQVAPKNAEPLYQLGLAYLAAGSVTEGVGALVKATTLDPKHAGAQVTLAELLASSQDKTLLEDARKRVQEVLSAAPAQSDALTALALTESRLGDLRSAEEHLREALQASPASLKASIVLARIKLGQRDPAGAEAALRAVVTQTPQSVDARLAMAEFQLAVNKPLEAEKELQAALGIDNRNARAMLGLAALYSASGKKEDAVRMYQRISGLGDSPQRHLYAAYLFSQGDRQGAVKEYERLARQSPNDRDSRSRLVAAYLLTGRSAEAERILDTALKHNAQDVDALLMKSEVQLRAANYEEARKNLSEVLRFKPDSADAHRLQAEGYAARGNTRLQRQELSEALQFRPDLIDARIELATLYIEGNSAQAAVDLLNQAPPSQKQGIPFLVLRNHALYSMGNYAEFAKGVAEGLATARTPDLLVQEAQVKATRKDFAGALASLHEALKLNPEHLGVWDVMLWTYSIQNNASAGLELLREHAARYPRSARLQSYLGQRMAAAGKPADARRAFTLAKAADPGNQEATLALAQLDLNEGNLAAVRQALAGLGASAADAAPVQLLWGGVEFKAGNHQAAIQHYRKVLESDPNRVLALNNLASLLAEYANQPDEALKYAQRAKELAPASPDVGGTIGWIYYRRGIYATALEYFRDAVKLDAAATSTNAVSRRYYLGLTYLKLGNLPQGLEILQQALKSHPDVPEAEVARAAIRQASKTTGQ